MSLTRELVAAFVAEIAADPELARELAEAFAPHLSADASAGWMGAVEAVDYLGLGSLDALDRMVRDGLPSSQPYGPGGRRYFHRTRLDNWMETR